MTKGKSIVLLVQLTTGFTVANRTLNRLFEVYTICCLFVSQVWFLFMEVYDIKMGPIYHV